ncbi:MAG: hypothetical protein JXA13_11025 [Anaerolineales bacterium]|nr:hypothetical protein [Anaerolineales bacterium]
MVRILPGAKDIYGNPIRDEYSFSFSTGNRRPYARLVLPNTPLVYRAEADQDFNFEYMNLDQATISLHPLDFDQFSSIIEGTVEAVELDPGKAAIQTWEIDTTVTKNHIHYLKFKLEDKKGGPLKPGYYFLGMQGEPLKYDEPYYQGAVFIVAEDNITLKTTETEALAWVTDLESGQPQSGVEVIFYNKDFRELGQATTNRQGLAYLDGLKNPLHARINETDCQAFASIFWGSGVSTNDFGLYASYYSPPQATTAYLYTDRPLYRPGQEVYFKGILRNNDDLHYSLPAKDTIYVVIEYWGEQVYVEKLPISELGGFHGTFTLDDEAALGTYTIYAQSNPNEKNTIISELTFRVAEYRKPDFQVSTTAEQTNLLEGEEASFALEAEYYSGGEVANAEVNWFVEASPFYFHPSGDFGRYNFSDWDRDQYRSENLETLYSPLADGTGTTDQQGRLDVSLTSDMGARKSSQQLQFKANVVDVAGNLVSSSTSIIVHQSELYTGIRPEEYIGIQGEEQAFQLVVLDWDAIPVAGKRLSIDFVERRWYSIQKQDEQGQLNWETSVKEIPIGQTSAITDEEGLARVGFTPPSGGVYKAIVTVHDDQGRSHTSSAYTWVSSNAYVSWRQTNDRAFELVVDKDSYSPGETAKILIAQPFEKNVYALITQERGHIYKQEVIQLKGNSTIYEIPVTGDLAPLTYVTVTVISSASEDQSPDFKIGMARINVDLDQQTLDVSIAADKKTAGPGDKVTYRIRTKDYQGHPVPAEVSLSVVDKAALALAPSNSSPILSSFYPERGLGVRSAVGIVQSADDFNAEYRKTIPDGQGSGGGGGETSLGIVTVRQDFKDTAHFEASVMTDADGKAEVTIRLPENLTTWQADARAVTADSQVGQATAELVSTKPVFVQLQTPRFFIVGDRAQIGAAVHNNTSRDLEVELTLEAEGVDLVSPVTTNITVNAKQQAYAAWEVVVSTEAKRADLTLNAISGEYMDSTKPVLGTLANQGIPVYNYTATEIVGTAGMLDTKLSITEGIQLSTRFTPRDTSLSIEVAPSLTASMQNGLKYLEEFPYACNEQVTSRLLANLITSNILQRTTVPDQDLQEDLDTNINKGLQHLYGKQNYDGGWGWWGTESDPYVTAYVLYGLFELQRAGYSVSEARINSAVTYVNENMPAVSRNSPSENYNRYAFMLYVLAQSEQNESLQTASIYDRREALNLYGKAFLAQALYSLDPQDKRIDSLISDLGGAAILSAAGVHWEEETIDRRSWNTDTRTSAIVLDAFVRIKPDSPLIANAVRWLMTHRDNGHWRSTQETAWVLMAMNNWMEASQEFDSSYKYAVGLNGEFLEQGEVTEENLDEPVNLVVDGAELFKEEQNHLVFTRTDGPGNMYYSAYLSTTLSVDEVQPLDQGISISRQYFTLDDPTQAVTEIARGELVQVRLTIIAPESLHYVIIDDPLPAGFEAIDASIATDALAPTVYNMKIYKERGWGWWYFDHTELRDEKVVLSADYLPAGTYVYTYIARASTAGAFHVIPPTASEFYFPDVSGRGSGSVFTVTPQ